MKIINLLKKEIYRRPKTELFLLGFYIVFIFIMILAAIIDLSIENYDDGYIEIFFLILTLLSLSYYKYSKDFTVALYSIVIIGTLTTYSLLVSNDFNISIFHSTIPLVYFALFTLKRSLIYTLIHQIIVICLYTYGYNAYPHHLILHNNALLVGTAMGSLIIVFFGIVYHVSVEKSYQKLIQSDKQKELLLQEVHHRVKNNLNIISSILGLQLLRETDEGMKEVFEKNRLRIDSIAMVHEILYTQKDFKKINIYEYLHQLSSTIIDISEEETIIIMKDDVVYLPFETVLEIGIITTELIINSMKHAFTNNDKKIYIDFETRNDVYVYKYQDSNQDKVDIDMIENKKSLGLKLINMMVEQMKAKIYIENKKGLIYTIRIPINES